MFILVAFLPLDFGPWFLICRFQFYFGIHAYKWSKLGLQRIFCTSPTANSIQTWHSYPSWCWVVHFQNKAIVSNLGMETKECEPEKITHAWFLHSFSLLYTPFIEAINSRSSHRPHKFAILTDFFNTETSLLLPKKNKVNRHNSSRFMKGNGLSFWLLI